MTNDFERDALRCWGKMRRSRKASSWGLRVTGQTGDFQMEVTPKQKLNWSWFTTQPFEAEMQHLAVCTSLCAKSTYNTRGLADRGFLHTFIWSPPSRVILVSGAVEPWQSYAAETSVILPQSTPGTSCRIGYPIVPGMSHVLAGLSSPGLLFCSQNRDAYLNQGRFKLKKKEITLKYNPLLKTILKYYIFRIWLLSTQELEYSGKILFEVSRKTAKLVSCDLKRQESHPESSAESSPVVLLTLRIIGVFCCEIGSPKLDSSWCFLMRKDSKQSLFTCSTPLGVSHPTMHTSSSYHTFYRWVELTACSFTCRQIHQNLSSAKSIPLSKRFFSSFQFI